MKKGIILLTGLYISWALLVVVNFLTAYIWNICIATKVMAYVSLALFGASLISTICNAVIKNETKPNIIITINGEKKDD